MDKVKSFNIINIAFYDDGSEVQTKFLTKSGKVNQKENNWEGEIKVIFSPIRHEHLYFWLQQAVHVMFLRSFSILYFSGIEFPKITMVSFSKLTFRIQLNEMLGVKKSSTELIALFSNLLEL